jgi:CrcB protein
VLRTRWDVLTVISLGGAVGSLCRWSLTLWVPHPSGTFPWATLVANTTGCFLLGVLMVFTINVLPPSRYLRPFLGVGVLGGYTTFSTYMLDARNLLVTRQTALAGQYVFGTLAAGLVAVWLGVTTARLLTRLPARRDARRRGTR